MTHQSKSSEAFEELVKALRVEVHLLRPTGLAPLIRNLVSTMIEESHQDKVTKSHGKLKPLAEIAFDAWQVFATKNRKFGCKFSKLLPEEKFVFERMAHRIYGEVILRQNSDMTEMAMSDTVMSGAKYTAILFAVSKFSGETFTFSREVDTDDKKKIYYLLKSVTHVTDDDIDTITLIRNGKTAPEVFRHWMAISGDFEGL